MKSVRVIKEGNISGKGTDCTGWALMYYFCTQYFAMSKKKKKKSTMCVYRCACMCNYDKPVNKTAERVFVRLDKAEFMPNFI